MNGDTRGGTGDGPGERIARARRRRGMSQAVLAGLVGRSESWLSQVERGLKPADSYAVLTRMAAVLHVTIEDLVGAGDSEMATVRAYPPAAVIEEAMLRYDGAVAAIGGVVASGEADEVRHLRESARAVYRWYQAGRYAEAGQALPSLIRRAEVSARSAGGDAPAACETRAVVYDTVAAVLHRVGVTSLAWTAADRAMTAAAQSGNAVRAAAAAWRLSYVITGRKHPSESLNLAMGAAEALERVLRAEPGPLSVYGALHLAAIDAAASLHDRATVASLLATAGEIAGRTGDRNEFGTAFGPANVALHRLSAELRFGAVGAAVAVGESVDPGAMPRGCAGRRTQLHLDLARAYALRRQDTAAVNMLLEAERLSPQLLRHYRPARDTIELLLGREHRPSTPGLRALAQRTGVTLPAPACGCGTRTRMRPRRVHRRTGWPGIVPGSFTYKTGRRTRHERDRAGRPDAGQAYPPGSGRRPARRGVEAVRRGGEVPRSRVPREPRPLGAR